MIVIYLLVGAAIGYGFRGLINREGTKALAAANARIVVLESKVKSKFLNSD